MGGEKRSVFWDVICYRLIIPKRKFEKKKVRQRHWNLELSNQMTIKVAEHSFSARFSLSMMMQCSARATNMAPIQH